MLNEHQRRWGIDQWAAFLSSRELPCMPRSKVQLKELEEARGERLAARELADIAAADPFLCLRLLRQAEKQRVQRLGHETTTPVGTVMQLGTSTFHKLLRDSPETDQSRSGLAACETRAHLASQLALCWTGARSDMSPDEIAMAALLSELGELLLWSFAPDLPQTTEAMVRAGKSPRSVDAQVAIWGFRFKDLTLKCAAIWHLPPLLTQLIRGVDNHRANLSRLCVDTVHHLSTGGPHDPALASDIAKAGHLIPGPSLAWLSEQLPGLEAEQTATIALEAAALLAPSLH